MTKADEEFWSVYWRRWLASGERMTFKSWLPDDLRARWVADCKAR